MSDCLARHYGYQVITPAPGYGAVLETFAQFLDDCSKPDTAIIYFSGHGLPRGGRLFFPLRDETARRVNRIDLNQVLRDFQDCDAQNRLVVLDCCHATASDKTEWNLSRSDKYLILAASRITEAAKEVDALQGGLMTTNLVDLLACPPDSATAAGPIYVQGMFHELERRIERYRDRHPDEQIFPPNLLGNAGVDFPLGTPPLSHSALVLRAVAENKGMDAQRLATVCSALSDADFATALARLRAEKCVDVLHDWVFLLDNGRKRLKR